ncbi:hypothetical protein PG995_007827 [Apiospora arundinis]
MGLFGRSKDSGAGARSSQSSNSSSSRSEQRGQRQQQQQPQQQTRGFGPPAPPPPFPPPPPPQGPSRARPAAAQPAERPPGSIGIGIETEFLLDVRRPVPGENQSMRLFAREMCKRYNTLVPARHPRMFSLVQNMFEGPTHLHWCMTQDPTIETAREPWGIEMVSPILSVYQGSLWRRDVDATWRFLEQNYTVTANEDCSTHVHMSLTDGYTVVQLKRLAQAIIHFEPAIEALLPPARRGNEYARSNWVDNENFAYRKLTRDQSIAVIEGCRDADEVINLMNPKQSRYFGWNFLALKKYSTVEFRRGASSLTVEDVFMWVDFAISFLQASMRVRGMEDFKMYPPSVGGLSMFVHFANLPSDPGMHVATHLDRLFAGRKPNERVEPVPVGRLSAEKQKKLAMKIKADSQSNPMLTKIYYAQNSGVI